MRPEKDKLIVERGQEMVVLKSALCCVEAGGFYSRITFVNRERILAGFMNTALSEWIMYDGVTPIYSDSSECRKAVRSYRGGRAELAAKSLLHFSLVEPDSGTRTFARSMLDEYNAYFSADQPSR